jgi:hypothetical protein
MKKTILQLSIPALVFILIGFEIIFRTIFPASNPPEACFEESNAVYHYCPNQGKGKVTFGTNTSHRSKWFINNEGWNSSAVYKCAKKIPRIAIIGDSYVEAFEVDVDNSFPALLRAQLGTKYDVYSFGMSGYPLSQYLHVSRYISCCLHPDIMIFNIVHDDFEESISEFNKEDYHLLTISILDTVIEDVQPRPNYSFREFRWTKRLLRKSAIARYLVFNAGLSFPFKNPFDKTSGSAKPKNNMQDTNYNANIEVASVKKKVASIRKAVTYIFERLRAENPDTRLIFIMDGPRNDIYHGRAKESSVLFLHQMMQEICGEMKLELLDLSNAMYEDYDEKRKKFDSAVHGPWNEYGHQFVAEQIKQYLEPPPETEKDKTTLAKSRPSLKSETQGSRRESESSKGESKSSKSESESSKSESDEIKPESDEVESESDEVEGESDEVESESNDTKSPLHPDF